MKNIKFPTCRLADTIAPSEDKQLIAKIHCQDNYKI